METGYRIEPFDGSGDVMTFIRQYEVKSATWADKETNDRLGQYLRGTAALWRDLTLSRGVVTDKIFELNNENDWKSALIKEFGTSSLLRFYKAEQAEGELGVAFLYRVLKIYQDNVELHTSEGNLIEILINKMTVEYRKKVKLERAKDLKDLKEICKFLDEQNEGLKANVKIKKKVGKNRICYKCRKKGHVAKECTYEKKRKNKNH
jgi:hypothetical protein